MSRCSDRPTLISVMGAGCVRHNHSGGAMKITRIETVHLGDYPHILFVGVHTDEGLVGWGDTYYMTDALRGYIHQFAAPMLLGHDPLAIELHWRRLYEVIAHIAGKGAEIRGLSDRKSVV